MHEKSRIQPTDKWQFNLTILQVWNAYLRKGSSYQNIMFSLRFFLYTL